jgi:predicted deacetylase
MKRLALLGALVALLLIPATAAATPYRTDTQAAHYLKQARGGSWFCLNGYYGKREQRTGRHLRQRNDERFGSFTCTGEGPALYLQTRAHGGWIAIVDR